MTMIGPYHRVDIKCWNMKDRPKGQAQRACETDLVRLL